MAAPTVFISSTFYDLRYVREGLRRFIESLGYIAVLSEDGTVFYDPKTNAAEACLVEIGNADMLVLILGGRYGSPIPGGNQSITNAEYQQAIKDGIPVFALIENDTYSDYQLYQANHSRPDILNDIVFPHADSPRIFDFIQEIQGQVSNNALVSFKTAADIENYLRSQWAGMLHMFLGRDNQEAKVASNLEMLAQVNARIELLAEQILNTVGNPLDRLVVRLLQEMVNSKTVADMSFMKATPTPGSILIYETATQCAGALGVNFRINENKDGSTLSGDGSASPRRFKEISDGYLVLRERQQEIVSESSATAEEVVAYERDNPDMLRPSDKNIARAGQLKGEEASNIGSNADALTRRSTRRRRTVEAKAEQTH